LTQEQALGSGWKAVIHPEDLSRVLRVWKEAPLSINSLEYESRWRRGADGGYRWFLTRAVPVRDKRGTIEKWYGVINDIEDRKRAEQLQTDLAHINRVSVMGEMAASFAHEIKQPISAATTNAQISLWLLDRDQLENQDLREAVSAVAQSVKRAAETIDHVRSLSKKSAQERELVDLNQVIREIEPLFEYESRPSSVAIKLKLSEQVPQVRGDRVQLQQVVMNLMLNAIEAMKDSGGELVVTSELTDSGQVLISLSDTGVGLPENEEGHIFEAFFSTKPQGTGMGLAISRSIVESHGGRLWAKGNPERGATFYFELPRHESEAA
jgi:signal transduction histidine kinase